MVKTRTQDGEVDSFEEILRPLRESIKSFTDILDGIEKKFEDRLRRQEDQLRSQAAIFKSLINRIETLERKSEFAAIMHDLNKRKIDDQEQFSMKINLRIEGIPLGKNETPATIMSEIQARIKAAGLKIPAHHFDRCHRNGVKKEFNGVSNQSVLLKMCFWRDRDIIYSNRKKLEFKVYPQLTRRRAEILSFAKDRVQEMESDKNIDFVFVDRNCKLSVRSNSGKFHVFNSKVEFMNIVSWISSNDADEIHDEWFEKFNDLEPTLDL